MQGNDFIFTVQDFRKSLVLRHQGLIDFQKLAPVPLQIIKFDSLEREEFGRSGFVGQAEVETPLKFYDYRQLFRLGEEDGKQYVDDNSKYIKIDESTEARYKNVIGVVGAAGIGKTTLAKSMLNYTLDFMIGDQAYVFFLPLRSIDFDKKMSVLEFLVKYTLPTWEHNRKNDNYLLTHLQKAQGVFIIIDGLDEVDFEILRIRSPDISLYDYTFPDKILKNLLAGHLLPNAKKFISSRPGAFHQLHPHYRPHFVVKALGLSNASQSLLIEQLCTNNRKCADVKKQLETHPNIARFCVNPMHCIMVIKHLLNTQNQNSKTVTLSQVFVSTFDACIRSDHFKGNLKSLAELTALAFHGIEQNQFIFPSNDLHGDKSLLEVFLRLQIVSKREFHMKILDGDKRFFFSHLQWQEFFAALHLMFVVTVEKFSETVVYLHQPRWSFVAKFLFGFCSPPVGRMAAAIFPGEWEQTFETKQQILKKEVLRLLSSGVLKKQAYIFKLCGWAFEANSDSTSEMIVASLPQKIEIAYRLDPSDIAALCYVLRRADTPRSIAVNLGNFIGNALEQLVNATNQSIHKVS